MKNKAKHYCDTLYSTWGDIYLHYDCILELNIHTHKYTKQNKKNTNKSQFHNKRKSNFLDWK